MKRAYNAGAALLALIASALTIIFGWSRLTGQSTPDAKFSIGLISSFFVILAVLLVTQEFRYSRKARYAEALEYLNHIALEIKTCAVKDPVSTCEMKNVCAVVVDQLANIFSLVTATRCSTCIKLIELPHGNELHLQVVTLCRDRISREREDRSSTLEHWVHQNTDFEQLFDNAGTPRGDVFFANNLPGKRDYKNSSFAIRGTPTNVGVPIIGDIVRNFTWTLPYKSTIVVPIRPQYDPQKREKSLVGYLCVDSRSRGAFRRRYDIDVIGGIAICLYDLVEGYREQVRQLDKQEEKV